jgi:hypothetical protein
MAKTYTSTIPKKSPQLPHSDGDGNQVHNEILLSLPREERDMVFPRLEFVRLKSLQLLYEVGDSIKSAYFCNTGMISTLNVFPGQDRRSGADRRRRFCRTTAGCGLSQFFSQNQRAN